MLWEAVGLQRWMHALQRRMHAPKELLLLSILQAGCRDRKANNPDVVGSGLSRRQHLSLTLRNK